MGLTARQDRQSARAPWRRALEATLVTLAVFVLLAITGDVLLAMREPDARMGSGSVRPAQDGHKRALLLGDSLVGGAAPELSDLFDSHGVETRFEGAPGTGPLTPQGFWRGELEAAVAEFNPDVVVIEACCNYDPEDPHRLYGGTVVPADSPAMYQQWQMATLELVSLAGGRGAQVFVVAVPPPEPSGVFGWLSTRIGILNQIYAASGVPVIDWGTALEPTDRTDDGLHLTDSGDRRVAEATWAGVAAAFASRA